MSRMGAQELAELFNLVKPNAADARSLGGSPAAFVNGNLFMRVRRQQFVLRLSERHRGEVVRRHGASVFEPSPGRPMREYVVLPDRMLADRKALMRWVRLSHDYAASLDPLERTGAPRAAPRAQEAPTSQLPRMED